MSLEESFEQLLNENEIKKISVGETVEGTVVSVKEDEIVLNIDYKSDGVISRNEYTKIPNVDLTTKVKPGDKLEAKVIKLNDGEGQVALSTLRLAQEKGSKRIEEAFNNKEVLTATVSQVRDGGLTVLVDETEVFIPASLVSDRFEKDLSKYNGQEIQFVITEYTPNSNPRRRRIIGNRKTLLVEEREKKQKEVLDTISVGDTVEGTVKNVTTFGAFIDLGGIDDEIVELAGFSFDLRGGDGHGAVDGDGEDGAFVVVGVVSENFETAGGLRDDGWLNAEMVLERW